VTVEQGGLGRAFVAVVPPGPALDAIEAAVAPVRDAAEPRGGNAAPELRWVGREQWHVTLQFLGRVDDAESVVEALAAALDDSLANVTAPDVRVGGAGAFPSPRRATVIWLGLAAGAVELGRLAGAVAAATEPFGSEDEPRPYRAHLTVARASRPCDLTAAVEALAAAGPGPVWTAGEVVLLESDTRPDGVVYREVARVRLASQRA
jgi:RNA 2',3'-cyclic 3'-phosphodiesterase